jgi:hypothetical protein
MVDLDPVLPSKAMSTKHLQIENRNTFRGSFHTIPALAFKPDVRWYDERAQTAEGYPPTPYGLNDLR